MAFLHSKTQDGFPHPKCRGTQSGHEAARGLGLSRLCRSQSRASAGGCFPPLSLFPYVGALSDLLEDHSRSSSLSLQGLASRKWEGEGGPISLCGMHAFS